MKTLTPLIHMGTQEEELFPESSACVRDLGPSPDRLAASPTLTMLSVYFLESSACARGMGQGPYLETLAVAPRLGTALLGLTLSRQYPCHLAREGHCLVTPAICLTGSLALTDRHLEAMAMVMPVPEAVWGPASAVSAHRLISGMTVSCPGGLTGPSPVFTPKSVFLRLKKRLTRTPLLQRLSSKPLLTSEDNRRRSKRQKLPSQGPSALYLLPPTHSHSPLCTPLP